MNNEHQMKEIVLRDLEPLLRQSLGEKVIVESFTTEPLLPPGENYGSTILSVRSVIKKTKDDEKEDLFLVAKMPPPTEYQRRMFDSVYTFKKEISMYEHILPAYNQLEKECGFKENELFNILPKFYGSRLSLDPSLEFDDNAVMLFENLKRTGYYTGNRSIGHDYDHSCLAVRAMARFHALGVAMKYKKPEVFEVLKVRCKCIDVNFDDFKDYHLVPLKKIQQDPVTNPYYDRCYKAFTRFDILEIWKETPTEPWSTISHADFWVNNIMFHRAKNGKVDDVKFVDFQNYLFFNPIRELIFYLFSSVDEATLDAHYQDLVNLYYDTFIGVLTKMGCDTEPFRREKFDEMIPQSAALEFPHLIFMLKILMLNAEEVDFDYTKIENLMLDFQGNNSLYYRLRRLILDYVKHNWM